MTRKQEAATTIGPGEYVLVRCSAAGVHAGILVERAGLEVELDQARRLWSWRTPLGASQFLSGVAASGLDHDHSKVGGAIHVRLLDACEVIRVSQEARDSIEGAPISERTL